MSKAAFEDLTFAELQDRYEEILQAGVSVKPDPLPSFLHISGFPHYEEVISNWYGFFFDTTKPHGFGTLFVDSLIELINESNTALGFPQLETCQVHRERNVEGKSIDLLLYDEANIDQGEEHYRNSIIIENKVFAALYNDLNFYIQNIEAYENKAGVVLSINTHDNLPAGYTCITHARLINRIGANLGRYLLHANDKYVILLKDFLQHVSLFRNTDNMKEYVTFYFNNAKKINELNQIRAKAMDAVIEELSASLEPTSFQRRRRYPESVNIRCRLHPNILMVLYTSKIFDEASYTLELWFTYELAKLLKSSSEIAKQPLVSSSVPEGFSFNTGKTGEKYAVVGKQIKSFTPTVEDIQRLPDLIATDLEQNWVPFITRLLQAVNVAPRTDFEPNDQEADI